MAIEKIQPTCASVQSPGADVLTPSSFVSGRLNVENAYAWPIDRWTASAAAGTSQRLNPGGAMLRSRGRVSVDGDQ